MLIIALWSGAEDIKLDTCGKVKVLAIKRTIVGLACP